MNKAMLTDKCVAADPPHQGTVEHAHPGPRTRALPRYASPGKGPTCESPEYSSARHKRCKEAVAGARIPPAHSARSTRIHLGQQPVELRLDHLIALATAGLQPRPVQYLDMTAVVVDEAVGL